MKKRVFTIIAVVLVSAFAFNTIAREVVVDVKTLPETAQNFIKQNFADKKLVSAIKDSELLETEYKVYFSDGTKINFTSKGEWKEIEGNRNCIANSAIPVNIANYVTENYNGICIGKIEVDKELFNFQYNVELLNGIELRFDKNGAFMGFDD
ncbi:MAG: PepSY-like domain-containing protein [Bacteroidales bacterium]|nr:PepSY-like domain-containing protein [Bacteroidales bacterium]